MPLSKALYALLSTGSTQEMSQHDHKIVDWDVKHQLKQKQIKTYPSQLSLNNLHKIFCKSLAIKESLIRQLLRAVWSRTILYALCTWFLCLCNLFLTFNYGPMACKLSWRRYHNRQTYKQILLTPPTGLWVGVARNKCALACPTNQASR